MKKILLLSAFIFGCDFYMQSSESSAPAQASKHSLIGVVFSIRVKDTVTVKIVSPEEAIGLKLFTISHLSGALESTILEGFQFRKTKSGEKVFVSDFNKPNIDSYKNYTLLVLPKHPKGWVAYRYINHKHN